MNTKAIYDSRYRELVVHICAARKGRGMTQSELGRRMRLSRQTVQKIESCEVRLDLVRYVTLCRILGLKAGQLLGRLEEPSDEDDSFLPVRIHVGGHYFLGSAIMPKFEGLFGGHLVATFVHGEGFFGSWRTF